MSGIHSPVVNAHETAGPTASLAAITRLLVPRKTLAGRRLAEQPSDCSLEPAVGRHVLFPHDFECGGSMRILSVFALFAAAVVSTAVPAESDLGFVDDAENLTHCLVGPRDLDDDHGGPDLQLDFGGGYTVEGNLYFVNGCSEELTFWVCSVDETERYRCGNEPRVRPGGQTSSFSTINGDTYWYLACTAGDNWCNDDALAWYKESDGAPRFSDLSM